MCSCHSLSVPATLCHLPVTSLSPPVTTTYVNVKQLNSKIRFDISGPYASGKGGSRSGSCWVGGPLPVQYRALNKVCIVCHSPISPEARPGPVYPADQPVDSPSLTALPAIVLDKLQQLSVICGGRNKSL